jgi:hypothetical protein
MEKRLHWRQRKIMRNTHSNSFNSRKCRILFHQDMDMRERKGNTNKWISVKQNPSLLCTETTKSNRSDLLLLQIGGYSFRNLFRPKRKEDMPTRINSNKKRKLAGIREGNQKSIWINLWCSLLSQSHLICDLNVLKFNIINL